MGVRTHLYRRIEKTEISHGEDDLPTLSLMENITRLFAMTLNVMYRYDPMLIYKGTYNRRKRTRYRLYLSRELRIPVSKVDEWRRKLIFLDLLGLACLLIRFSVICFVQLAKYQATIYPQEFSSGGNSSSLPIMVDTVLTIFLKQHGLYYIFDNALSDFPSPALSIHIILLVSSAYVLFFMPYYYSIKPSEAINLRFGYDPRHEMKRMDLLLRRQLESHLLSVVSYKISIPLLSWTKQAACSGVDIEKSKHQVVKELLFETVSRQQRSCQKGRVQFSFDPVLRSFRYSPKYHKLNWRTTYRCTAIVCAIMVPFGLMIQTYIVGWSLEMKCKNRGVERCTLINALTKLELYSIFELLCVMYSFGTALAVSITTILVHFGSQTIIVDEIRSDLSDLLAALRLLNDFQVKQLEPQSAHETNDKSILGEKRQYLNDALLKMLVKTKTSLDEFRAQAEYISEQVSSIIVFFGSSLVMQLTVGLLNGPDIRDLRLNVIWFMWISANAILFLCAYQYSKITMVQKIGWSILAQLLPGPVEEPELFYLDPLVSGWLRFIGQGAFTDVRNSIRPFLGVSLTFRQIIQLNFWITSLGALYHIK